MMKCPFCGYPDSKVVDSRSTASASAIRRRRECLKCQKRFTTYETVEKAPMMVIKKDGRREPFDRNKLLAGLMKACQKRPISARGLEEIASNVERELRGEGELDQEIKSSAIGDAVLGQLKKVDKVAYVRFASVYKEFQDIETFVREIDELHNRQAGRSN